MCQSSHIGSAGSEKFAGATSCSSSSLAVIGRIFAFKERNPEDTILEVLLADPTGTMTLPQNLHRSSSSIGSAPQCGHRTVFSSKAVVILSALFPSLLSLLNIGSSFQQVKFLFLPQRIQPMSQPCSLHRENTESHCRHSGRSISICPSRSVGFYPSCRLHRPRFPGRFCLIFGICICSLL